MDGSTDGFAGYIEVIERRSGRRWRSSEEQAWIAAESLLLGAKAVEVARRHGATRWQVYDWRRESTRFAPETVAAPAFAVLLIEVPEPQRTKSRGSKRKPLASGVIELVVESVVIWADAMVILPQSGQRPAAELAVNLRPLAKLIREITPRRSRPCDIGNPIQHKVMI